MEPLRKEMSLSSRIKISRNASSVTQLNANKSSICGCCSLIRARTVLWYLTFVGFAINYMIRININITIVDMILPLSKSSSLNKNENKNHSYKGPECFIISNKSDYNSFVSAVDTELSENETNIIIRGAKEGKFSLERWFLDYMKVIIFILYYLFFFCFL